MRHDYLEMHITHSGIFLIAKAPTHTLNHPLVYIRYRALLENRGRIRVDLVISATMSFILFFFSLLLLFGYFHVHSIGKRTLMSHSSPS